MQIALIKYLKVLHILLNDFGLAPVYASLWGSNLSGQLFKFIVEIRFDILDPFQDSIVCPHLPHIYLETSFVCCEKILNVPSFYEPRESNFS